MHNSAESGFVFIDKGQMPIRGLIWCGAALFIFQFCIHAFVLPGSFILDDVTAIIDNEMVKRFDVIGLFSTDYWGRDIDSGLYRPLTMLTFALNYLIAGENPLIYHVINIVLNGAASVGLFVFASTIGLGLIPSLFSALLFSIHPLHGEALHLVVGRADLLVCTFTMVALTADALKIKYGSLLAAFCVVCAILSKESGASLPLLLMASDAYRRKSLRESIRLRWRFYVVLAGILLGWRLLVLWVHASPAMIDLSMPNPSDNALVNFDLFTRLAAVVEIQIRSLLLMLYPVKLKFFYGSNDLIVNLKSSWVLIMLLNAVLIGSIILLLFKWVEYGVMGFCVVAYLISSFITSNLIVVIAFPMAERFLYLPSVFFCLFVAVLFQAIYNSRYKVNAIIAAFIALIWFSVASVSNAFQYRSELGLLLRAGETKNRNGRFYSYLGESYRKLRKYEESEKAYAEGIDVDPDFLLNYITLSEMYLYAGKYKKSLDISKMAIRMAGGQVFTQNIVYAISSIKLGDYASGLAEYNKIKVFSNPADHPLFKYLSALVDIGGGKESGWHVMYEIIYSIEDKDDLRKLCTYMLGVGEYFKAAQTARRLLSLENNPDYYNLLGTALALKGERENAKEAFNMALRLDPTNAYYKENLKRIEF